MSDKFDISIVMTIVDGGQTLVDCLDALMKQEGGNKIEVLIPYDQVTRDAGSLADNYPEFTFINLGDILGGGMPKDALAMHKFYDTRRAAALKVADAPLIAIIEDRGLPAPNWVSEMIALHSEYPHGVIGGAVDNAVDNPWNWAIFFCDFGRYQAPIHVENPEYVTDTNICYKADTLMRHRDLWDERYVESELHWAMARAGETMMISDRAVTRQNRPSMPLRALLSERYHWARMFGQVRGAEISLIQRLKYILAAPILPFVLLLRHARRQKAKGRHVGRFWRSAHLTFLLLTAWSAGEFVGYLEARRREETP
jgi:GT2 family glycosyltransferase